MDGFGGNIIGSYFGGNGNWMRSDGDASTRKYSGGLRYHGGTLYFKTDRGVGVPGIINRSETVGKESHGISNIRSGGIGYPHVNYYNKDIAGPDTKEMVNFGAKFIRLQLLGILIVIMH